MASARVRFALEAAALAALGVALAFADVDLTAFAIAMAVAWVVVAALERTLLQPRGDQGKRQLDGPSVPEKAAAAGADEVDSERAALVEPHDDVLSPIIAVEREEEAVEPSPVADHEPPAAAAVEPLPEPVADEAGAAGTPEELEAEQEPVSDPEPPTPAPPPVQVVQVPPEPGFEPAPAPAPAPPGVVELPLRRGAGWNVWELERRARDLAGVDERRHEEWAALLVYLRDYASPDGMLPPEFDGLVRESFAELLATDRA